MVDLVADTGLALLNALNSIWTETLRVIPGLVGALIVILVGVIIGKILKEIVVRVLKASKVDDWIEEHKLKAAIGHLQISNIAGSFIKWYVIALFLAQALALINMQVLKDFTQLLVIYIPKVLGGLVIFIGALLVARFIRNMIEATQHQFKKTVAIIVEVIIIYMGAVIALQTMDVPVMILIDAFNTAFTALVAALAITIGIAFGLSFYKDAKQIVADLRKEMK